jgi:hypothetical protein
VLVLSSVLMPAAVIDEAEIVEAAAAKQTAADRAAAAAAGPTNRDSHAVSPSLPRIVSTTVPVGLTKMCLQGQHKHSTLSL